MFEIAPNISPSFEQAGWKVEDIVFSGMRTMVKYVTKEKVIWGDAPVGHALTASRCFYYEYKGSYSLSQSDHWFYKAFKKTIETKSDKSRIKVTSERFDKTKNQIVILNCIDIFYGHVLLKLLNAQYYQTHYPDYDVMIIIPSFLAWMVPSFVSIIITVDVNLREGYRWIDGLDAHVKNIIAYYQKAFLSKTKPHPKAGEYDIELFTGVKPFGSINQINKKESYQVTFIWRGDRIPNVHMGLVKLALGLKKRMNFPFLFRILLWRQKCFVKRLHAKLKRSLPDIRFILIGLDDSFSFPPEIKDLRTNSLNKDKEKEWCNQYAKSHLVIGIHGSNMLLPSAHAGMTLELLPDSRIQNYLQDILFHPPFHPQELLYKYRFLPLSSNFNTIWKTAVNMLRKSKRYTEIMDL